MDPLTHTLVGASLAATRLGRTTRGATAALVIGANLPDLDVLSYVAGGDAALGFRRGWTHGVLALAVLPALFAVLLHTWRRHRPGPTPDRALSIRWLLVLSYLAVLTHPCLDWLNTYGMRWWMPFDGTWYYGDAVFIMDPWIWLALGGGWLAGRRPGSGLLAGWGVVAVLLLAVVTGRAPGYLPAVAAVLAVLLLALLWKPVGARAAARTALGGLVLAAVFIGAMLTLHALAEERIRGALAAQGVAPVEQLMVGPMPANPLGWEFVVRSDGRLRHGRLSLTDPAGTVRFSGFERPDGTRSETWPAIEASGDSRGFLGWARFPWLGPPTDDGSILVMDARYARRPTSGFGGAAVRLSEPPP